MPNDNDEKQCRCGCGEMPVRGRFLPGHDQKLLAAICRAVGGVEELCAFVERHTGKKVFVDRSTRLDQAGS